MKNARLDQILLRLRYATQDQITRGLQRQKAHGGRLGMHLVQMGFVSEHQLVEALAEQSGLPWITLEEGKISPELVARMPPGTVGEGILMPLGWDEESKTLSLALADPGDEAVAFRAGEGFGARRVRLALAPESTLRTLGRRLGGERSLPEERVELPELFREASPEDPGPVARSAPSLPSRRVLLVTRGAANRNFLPPVLVREGVELLVVDTQDQVEEALKGPPFEAVLVSDDFQERVEAWVREGRIRAPRGGFLPFTSVSSGLLDHPVPYDSLIRSLRVSVQLLAEARAAHLPLPPPHPVVARDVDLLGRASGLGRVALDALYLVVHLLLPPGEPGDGEDDSVFGGFHASRELALRLRFQFPLERLLDGAAALFRGEVRPEEMDSRGEEGKASQVLALVWHHHLVVAPQVREAPDALVRIRRALLTQASRLAGLEMVEVFLQLLEERGSGPGDGKSREVLVVGGEGLMGALGPRLARAGCVPLTTDDLADAQTMAQRRPPSAVILDHDRFPGQVVAFCRVAKLEVPLLLYMVTTSTDPGLTLSLLDAGAEDVFSPPLDFDVIVARVTRALRAQSRSQAQPRPAVGEFSASFSAFSFLDLIQTLGHGLKSVRIEITGGMGESAVIFLDRGRLVHAACGHLSGAEAIYRVISWEDDGAFAVLPETRFPSPTIRQAIETVLMEGCRLLDESRV